MRTYIKILLSTTLFGVILLCNFGLKSKVNAVQVIDCMKAAGLQTPPVTDAEWNAQCVPPRGKDLQTVVVNIIYYVWAVGSVGFILLGVYLGYMYMTSGSDVQKQQDLQKRIPMLIIGIVLFFSSYFIAGALMKVMITNSTDCYDELKAPAFRFFFPTVCGNVDTLSTIFCSGSCTINDESNPIFQSHDDGLYCLCVKTDKWALKSRTNRIPIVTDFRTIIVGDPCDIPGQIVDVVGVSVNYNPSYISSKTGSLKACNQLKQWVIVQNLMGASCTTEGQAACWPTLTEIGTKTYDICRICEKDSTGTLSWEKGFFND
jgi:hypothetical protein